MSELPASVPLALTPGKDVTTDGFNTADVYDPAAAMIRDGAIVVDGLPRDNPAAFEIYLAGDAFTDRSKPALGPVPARINLNPAKVLGIVQDTRRAWTEAVVDFNQVKDGKHGGEEPARLFDESAEPAIDDATFHKIAAALAVAGDDLFTILFERGSPELHKVADALRKVTQTKECILTVSAEHFHIPWGMLYTHPVPGETLDDDGANYDRRGFWGYQHIIEQFTERHYVTEPLTTDGGKLQLGAALDENIDTMANVKCIADWRAFTAGKHAGQLNYAEWTTRPKIRTALKATPFDHRVLYFLCHAEGAGTVKEPNLDLAALRLTDSKSINAINVTNWIPKPFTENRPLVFLNACQAGHIDTLLYHQFTLASVFLAKGATCVVGPQVEVPAVFAGAYGRRFFEELVRSDRRPQKAGMIMRDLNREFWAKRNPLGLVYSLYAGADCHVSWPVAEKPA